MEQWSDGFHWRDGWTFKRMDDGSVRIRGHYAANSETGGTVNLIIPAQEWASIVCSVSKGGESDGRWDQAQDFHGR